MVNEGELSAEDAVRDVVTKKMQRIKDNMTEIRQFQETWWAR